MAQRALRLGLVGLLGWLAVHPRAASGQSGALTITPEDVVHSIPSPEAGRPFFIDHFDAQRYKAQPSNWNVAQDDQGLIYVANLSGVLVYDGVQWQLIRTTTDARVRSLDVDASGTVYVGAWGDVGFLAPDSTGTQHFVSLIAEVAPEDRDFEDVWSTRVTSEGVYFQTGDRIFRWDGEAMKVWAKDKLHTAYRVHDQFFFRHPAEGLMTIRGDSMQVVPGGEFFAQAGYAIYVMVPYDDSRILIGTWKGFFLYDGATVTPFATDADPYLKDEQRLYHGTALPNGYFALSILGRGVLILDHRGRLVQVLDERINFPDSFVNYLYVDNQGGLWGALHNSGVVRVDVPSQLTSYGPDLGLKGTISSIRRHLGTLYVATGAGLYYLDQHPVLPGEAPRSRFVQVPGVPPTWSLRSMGATMLAATEDGIYLVENGQGQRITKTQVFALHPSERFRNRIYVGLVNGLGILQRRGEEWVLDHEFAPSVDEEVWKIQEDGTALWVGGVRDGVLRLRLSNDGKTVEQVDRFGSEEGLPPSMVQFVPLLGETVFSTRLGVYRYMKDDGAGSFVSMPSLMPSDIAPDDSVLSVVADDAGNVWREHNEHIHIGWRQADGSYVFEEPAVLRFPMSERLQLYMEPGGVVWIGNGNELIRYAPDIEKDYESNYQALVRAVVDVHDQRIIYGGAVNPAALTWLVDEGIQYEHNNLRFDFAAPSFNHSLATEYQYYLEGSDSDWSDWTTQTEKTYSGLREGHYRFRVRARNEQGVLSQEGMLAFRLLPPWYRSWWAYLLYMVGFVSAVVMTVRYRAIVEENKRAQEQAAELTRERLVNERLQQANRRLQEANESLTQANRLKDEFLANTSHELRTPLTAILGFTAVLQEEVSTEHREFLGLINANGQRLLHTVNALLDLAKIRAGIVTLHREKIDAAAQVAEMMRMLAPLAREKDLAFELIRPDEPLMARLDPHYFDRILYNLIGNAIKFTDKGGVTVEVAEEADTLYLRVHDTGVGISESFLPHLFDEFKQESTGLGRLHEGSGLGLTITAHLVNLMDGKVEVTSSKGAGSTFTVVLPHDVHQKTPVEPLRAGV